MPQNIAIISTVYQNYNVLNDFFQSLNKQTNRNFHIFLSNLSSQKQKINSSSLPLTIIEGKNLGYSHGINLGLKAALDKGYQYFCVINNDTFVKDDFVKKSLESLHKNPNSIIGGKIYYAPGFEFHKSRYKQHYLGKIIWYAGGNIDWNNVYVKHLGVDEIDKGQFNKFEKTEFISGCLMLFDKTVVEKVGFWDESYFLYYEDADFCERAKKKEIKLYYDPSIIIWHKNAQSTDGSGSSIHQKYQNKNRLKFGLKYAPWHIKLHLIKKSISY